MNEPGSRSVSVIVACRNEEENIGECIRRLAEALPAAEILIVDGGSDRTFEIAEEAGRRNPRVVAVKNVNDRGKGHAVKTGIARASGDVMAQFDADMQFGAEDLPRLIGPVARGECDVCLGSRFLPGSNRGAYRAIPTRDLGNRLLALFISALTGRRVTDVTAGVKAWTRDAIRRIDFRDDAYSYEAELVVRARRLGLRVAEVPVSYASRLRGASMHRDTLAVAKAGLVIMGKALAARFRTDRAGA
jgi:glycosyltransferase involved in cell wall biosynthesis